MVPTFSVFESVEGILVQNVTEFVMSKFDVVCCFKSFTFMKALFMLLLKW